MLIEEFEDFLLSINLNLYREKYRLIKLVEMDLPKNIQAISLLYQVYWEQKKLLDFDNFYREYLNRYSSDIETFREKITMCKDCFYRGLPARIYRTWASIITQIHAGYVAESVFGKGSILMSAELDHSGVDFQINYKSIILNFQVKKTSFSREIRQEKKTKVQIKGRFIDIKYDVPSEDYFRNPKKRNGEYKLPYLRFINNKELKRLSNGFVIFTPLAFLKIKNELDG